MTAPPSFPIGAGPTSDVPYVWQSETTVPLTSTQMTLARIMLGFWSNFAASADPNGAPLPDWPRHQAEAPRRIGLLTGGLTEEISGDAYVQEHHRALWDALRTTKAPKPRRARPQGNRRRPSLAAGRPVVQIERSARVVGPKGHFMKIGIIGSGVVGKTLAAGFRKHGHEVEIGTRETSTL